VLFVDAAAFIVVVVAFAVARWIVPVVVGTIQRVKAFSEFLRNSLAGLAVQSVVFEVVFHSGFELLVIGDFTGFIPLLAGVVVTTF
jgi:hypothetical protein